MSAQSWFAPAVWFAAFTGARRGETLAMRWSDLNLDEAGATICRSLTQTDDVQRSTRSPSLRRMTHMSGALRRQLGYHGPANLSAPRAQPGGLAAVY